MRRWVIDASVAIKWVVPETGSIEALALQENSQLMAPDLLLAECGNVLWKQVRRGDIRPDQALQAAQALAQSDVELRPMRALLSLATELAIQIEHPAYDCFYLALARLEGCDLVTSDERFLRKLEQNRNSAGVRSLSSFTR